MLPDKRDYDKRLTTRKERLNDGYDDGCGRSHRQGFAFGLRQDTPGTLLRWSRQGSSGYVHWQDQVTPGTGRNCEDLKMGLLALWRETQRRGRPP
jgi:hypothetical protein